jgi:hypothetical protein
MTVNVKGLIDRKPPKNHHWHGVGRVTPDSSGRFDVGDGSHRDSVVTHNLPPGADHVRAGSTARLIPLSAAPQRWRVGIVYTLSGGVEGRSEIRSLTGASLDAPRATPLASRSGFGQLRHFFPFG